MEYRRLGTSGLKVSAISLGAWLTYGTDSVADENAIACVQRAIDRGINFIDVADVYSNGEAEKVVGRAINGYKRSDLVISTKAYWPMSENINDRGLSRKHIVESVNASLKRFDLDYIDIFFCHRFDAETPVEETIRAIETLIQQGKILYWGTSMWTAENIDEAYSVLDHVSANRPVVEQPKYNLLERDIVEGALEDAVGRHGMGLVVFSPLAQGILTGKYNDGIPENSRAVHNKDWVSRLLTEERLVKVRQFTTLAQDMGTTPAALALAWALTNPHVSSVITGASRPEQVDENLKALDVDVTDEVKARLAEIF